MMIVHRRTIAGSAPRRRQALLRTIERAASIASIRVRPVSAPALPSLRQYSIAPRAALGAATTQAREISRYAFRSHPPRHDSGQLRGLARSFRAGQRKARRHAVDRRPFILSGLDRLSA